MEDGMTRQRLAILAAGTAVVGWAMMTLGAYVRATESGLGCPDWPACHGKLVAGGHHALIEEAHRWLATILVVAVVGLALAVFRGYRGERRLTRPVLAMLAMVALQVVLGGMTVLLKNVAWTVVAHFGGAALLVWSIAFVAVRLAFPEGERPPRDSFTRLAAWLTALTFGLLLVGSTQANAGSDTVCGHTFPLCKGTLLPSFEHLVAINLLHRVWAGAVLLLAVWLFLRSRRDRPDSPAIKRTAALVCAMFFVQAFLGFLIVGVTNTTATEVVHSSFASATWLALATLASLTWTTAAGRAVAAGERSQAIQPPVRARSYG
jgi:heme a synthase